MEATETVIRQQEEDLPQESKTVVVLKGQDIWKAEAAKALIEAKKIKVIDNYTYIAAGEFRDKCAARGKGLLALLNPGCQAADKLHSDLVKDRDACVDPYQEAAKTAKAKLIAYDQEQERIRQEEQRRIEAENRRKEEERRREALRLAQEEAERQAKARQAEEQARLELAATLKAAGATDAADEVLTEAASMPAIDTAPVQEAVAALAEPIQVAQVVLPKTTPKVAGFSYRRIYDAKVVDRKLFLLAVIGGNIPDEAWQPNEQFLRQQAGSLKEALKWPGVKVTWKDV